MIPKNERNRFPHLAELIDCMAADNGWHHFGTQVWEWPENVDLATLEKQAEGLTTVEKEVFACGEHFEVRRMVKDRGLQDLDTFLGEVFDGDYQDNFLITDTHFGD